MKKFISKRLGAGALALTFLASALTGCGSKNATDTTVELKNPASDTAEAANSETVYRTVDEIKESGTVNIGVFSDKSPFGYVDENGEYQGYDVYFGNRIGEDLGVQINYICLV
ncbi:MAG: transporter substrate-binding domain-containing protein [Lachnospiraceae bacterium]|nr:transporter substrate-binding domain-containing protein [Lachnospiraceae bacterium]